MLRQLLQQFSQKDGPKNRVRAIMEDRLVPVGSK